MSRRSWQALTLPPATLSAGYVTGVFGDWAATRPATSTNR